MNNSVDNEQPINNTIKVWGIAGALGVGKSSLALKLQENWGSYLHIVELDEIRRYILWSSTEEEHVLLRKQLSLAFGLTTTGRDCWLDRTVFTRIIFSAKERLNMYSALATPILKNQVIKELLKHPECVVVWAYLIEEDYLDLINKKIIIVNTPSHLVLKRFYVHVSQNVENHYDDISRRISLEPGYDIRVHYLKSHGYDFIEYNNDKNFENIKDTIELLQR